MTMGRCKNCKHSHINTWVGPKALTCGHPKILISYKGEPEDDGVQIEADEGWGWIVGPEFGCIHFEEKE